jgi:murein DD-endopeptidase MepM/ murein hydrolase activator NlpD
MLTLKPYHALTVAVVFIAAACATTQAVKPAPAEPLASVPKPGSKPVKTVFPLTMSVCPGMTVANRPATDANLMITDFRPFVQVNGKVTLATAPVQTACFSSGFGARSFGNHKGIDFYSPDAVDIYAAAAGVVREKTYRDDFGNMLVIDHGDGVFTRYAHLRDFTAGLAEGGKVKPGDVIGQMGHTSKYNVANHLHYEVLTGEWGAQAGSFALTPVDPMKLPAASSGS